jgi:hypothetical protein
MLPLIKRIAIPTPLQLFASLIMASALLLGIYQGVLAPRLYNHIAVTQVNPSSPV